MPRIQCTDAEAFYVMATEAKCVHKKTDYFIDWH